MKIRVTRPGPGNFWYHDKVGQTFEVRDKTEEFDGICIYILKDDRYKGIRFENCEIVEGFRYFNMLKAHQPGDAQS